jgi:transcriptional regulator GlxA family with amidase domain
MKHISILVPECAIPSSVLGARFFFSTVNDLLVASGKQPKFQVQLIGLTKEVKINDGLFSIHPDFLIKDIIKTDLIIIPALSGNLEVTVKLNIEFIPWILQQYKNGTELASLCVGAFLLASTGLLKGKQCSTHWQYANEFRALFPDVNLVDDKIISEINGIYSSGGVMSSWNLVLYLIEKYTDRETAILASKYFLVDIERNSQSPFIIFKGQKNHNDEIVKKIQEYIEINYQDKIAVNDLSQQFGMSRRSFERRFKKATSNTIVEYIQRVKIEAAKKQLEIGRKTINEVMYDTGYNDTKTFRDVFKKIAGLSPIDYRNKYNKNKIA